MFLAIAAISWIAGEANLAAVDFANITVADNAGDPVAGVPTVSIPTGQSTVANGGLGTEGFSIEGGAVVGEYPIRIGADASNDADNGVLIASVSEFGRQVTNPSATEILFASVSTVGDGHTTSTNTRGLAGGLSIVTDRAGTNVATGSSYPLGTPMNANLAAAYFPFSQGWVGGTALNAVDSGAYTLFIGSSGLQLGVHIQQNFFGTGDNLIKIPGVQDTRRQGILLAMTAHNENNFAVVNHTADGDGFNLTSRANTQDASEAEADPISFVFLPLGTPNVTMGSIYGALATSAAPTENQPVAVLKSGNDFTIFKDDRGVGDVGTFRLSINGQTPSTGVLIVQSSSNLDGDGGWPADNLVTYQADGNDWLITSDDLPSANGVGQASTSNERQPYFQFAFFPFDAPPVAPGPLPQLNWSKQTVLAFDTTVTELDGNDNDQTDGTNGMYIEAHTGTQGVQFLGLRQNKGDNAISADGALPTLADGVMFATVNQGLRDNSTTGGLFEYGVVTTSLTGSPASWEFHTHTADPSNGEHNIDFSGVLFGSESGFPMAAQQPVASNGHLDVSLPGVDSLTDGVLMVTGYGNDDNFATVEPKTDGSGWDIDLYDNGATPEGDAVNYVFLPYATQNLVAGRVNPDGSLVNSTDTGAFTLVRAAEGEYLLTIDGRTADEGMLLLNGTGPDGSLDNYLVYEKEGNSFRILGLDMITSADSGLGELVDLEDTSFSFAFIDYITPPTLPDSSLPGDFDGDGDADGRDFLAWQRGESPSPLSAADLADWQAAYNGGALSASATAVPEPTTCVTLLGLVIAALTGRRCIR